MTEEKKKRSPLIYVAAGCGVLGVLSICVCAGIGYPAYQNYIAQTKRSEARSNLSTLYIGASSYYGEFGCTVDPAVTPNTPNADKQVLTPPLAPSFEALGFMPYDPIYYQYEIEAPPGSCSHGPNEPALYTFRARGDLDGNGVFETMEMVVGTDASNQMQEGPMTLVEEDGTRTTW